MRMARLIAMRGTCSRRQVGVVVTETKSNRILSLGYNGSLAGEPHCLDAGCHIVNNHCIRAEHAEINALDHISDTHDKMTLYCTDMCCHNCLRICLRRGVNTIYFERWYEDPDRDTLYFTESRKDLSVNQYIPGIAPGSTAAYFATIFQNGVYRSEIIERTKSGKSLLTSLQRRL